MLEDENIKKKMKHLRMLLIQNGLKFFKVFGESNVKVNFKQLPEMLSAVLFPIWCSIHVHFSTLMVPGLEEAHLQVELVFHSFLHTYMNQNTIREEHSTAHQVAVSQRSNFFLVLMQIRPAELF